MGGIQRSRMVADNLRHEFYLRLRAIRASFCQHVEQVSHDWSSQLNELKLFYFQGYGLNATPLQVIEAYADRYGQPPAILICPMGHMGTVSVEEHTAVLNRGIPIQERADAMLMWYAGPTPNQDAT